MTRKPTSPLPLARVLADDPQLAEWDARRRHESRLTQVLERLLPRPFAGRIWVSAATGDLLELATPTGAVAAVVRQRAPDLVAALAREGWEFTGIRVRVQPRGEPAALEKPVPRQWDSNASAAISRLEAILADGPLKASLARLRRGR